MSKIHEKINPPYIFAIIFMIISFAMDFLILLKIPIEMVIAICTPICVGFLLIIVYGIRKPIKDTIDLIFSLALSASLILTIFVITLGIKDVPTILFTTTSCLTSSSSFAIFIHSIWN